MGAGQEGRGGGMMICGGGGGGEVSSFSWEGGGRRKGGVGKTDKKCVSRAHQYFTIFQFFSKTRLFLFFFFSLFVAVFVHQGNEAR